MPTVDWMTRYFEGGMQFGFSIHNRRSMQAAEAAGVELKDGADMAVYVGPAHAFDPDESRHSILFTAWEGRVFPREYAEKIRKYKAVIVTAGFLVDAVRAVDPNKSVYVCPLGVDVEKFTYIKRRRPRAGEKFVYLWNGAAQTRKGWPSVVHAWAETFRHDPSARLYIKTTGTEKYERVGNVIFDSRRLPLDDLVRLYHSAHAYIFPSAAEGFGLTLAEAMATGLPCAYIPFLGVKEFIDPSCGFPIDYHLEMFGILDAVAEHPIGCDIEFGIADTESTFRAMLEMRQSYPAALRKGKAAAAAIRGRFTWGHVGRRLREIFEMEEKRWRQARIFAT